MNLTFGEHRASDQNVDYFMPPLEKLPPFTPWPLWKLALHALGLALLMGAIGGGLWL